MAKKTWTTVDIDGTDFYLPSNPNPPGPPRHVGADECCLCRMTYARDQFVYFRGKPYCIPNGCEKDIEGIRRVRSARRVSTVRER